MTDFVAALARKCEQAYQEIILVCGHDADCPQEWEEFPEKYGPCNCQMAAVKTTLDDLVAAAIREALEEAEKILQIALGTLADIANAEDMNESQRRHKASRIYQEILAAIAGLHKKP